jgi:hypothetical protein
MSDAIDVSGSERPKLTCLGIASDTQPFIDVSLVIDTNAQGGGSSTASSSSTSKRKPIDMNVDDGSRLEWATLFLDWLSDNAPSHDQLSEHQIRALAEQFNLWARVKGLPMSAYMFRWLKRVGIEPSDPVRDQEGYCPGCRR